MHEYIYIYNNIIVNLCIVVKMNVCQPIVLFVPSDVGQIMYIVFVIRMSNYLRARDRRKR